MTTDHPAIRIDDLSRDFASTRAVDGLTFEVPKGAIFGFLGPNGAGKTTTINLLLGLLEPSAGRALVLGLDPWTDGDQVRARVGAVLEHSGIYEAMTAEDNLELYGRAGGLLPADRERRIAELLGGTGLWERRHEKAGTWSRGMQQRLAVARALMNRPPLVFLDEPTAGLDVMAATVVREDLAQLAGRDGTTIFLTTHNMAEAERLCAQVAVIRSGQLIAIGSPAELRAGAGKPRVEVFGSGFEDPVLAALRERPEVATVERSDGHVVIELTGPVESGALVGLMVRRGAQIDEVRRGQASLEEVFVALMEEDR